MSEKATVLFAFGNQKGGVSKSTLTTVFGNYVHHTHSNQYKFAGVDGDDLQRSYFGFRVRDLDITKEGKSDKDLRKEVFEKEKEYGLYHILQVQSDNFKNIFIDTYSGTVDFMAIDLPGNLKQAGVMDSYMPVDVLFIPMNPANDADVEASVDFLKHYQGVDKLRADIGFPPVEKYLIRAKRDRRITYDHEGFLKRFEGLGVTYLDEEFPYSPGSFGRDVNTLLEFKKNKKDVETEQLCSKLFSILEKKYQEVNS